MMMMI
jgi:hypothetical protein